MYKLKNTENILINKLCHVLILRTKVIIKI